KFIEAVKREQPDILALSALLTTTIPRMKEVIQALSSANLRDRVRVMVGGAPVTQSFADSIGADGYAPDAVLALERAKQLLD
ncbi:MAG: cobalamin B12-binding domain-containing protein, partial [Chloroflexi bacterium]|nr:cobalamin B12-binding domain-containing protein [Chloroflexota bacterium]